MPGLENAKALNVCFRINEFCRPQIMDELLADYESIDELTIADKFNVTYDFHDIFEPIFHYQYHGYNIHFRRFIYHDYACYHMFANFEANNTMPYVVEWNYEVDQSYSETWTYDDSKPYFKMLTMSGIPPNVSMLYAILTPRDTLPWIEMYMVPIQKDSKFNHSQYFFTLSGESYQNERLQSPYVDDCIDYSKLGFFDRHDAINSCINDLLMLYTNCTYGRKIFLHGINMKSIDDSKNRTVCTKRYHYSDCNRENVFTHISSKRMQIEYGYNYMDFSLLPSDKPSFKIRSQAKIEDIDLVCYILGTIGIWLGLCFADFDPSILINFIAQKIADSHMSEAEPRKCLLEERLADDSVNHATHIAELTAHVQEFKMFEAEVNAILLQVHQKTEVIRRIKINTNV